MVCKKRESGAPTAAQQNWRYLCSARTQMSSLTGHSGLKDQMLPHWRYRSQLQLCSDPWTEKYICCEAAKKENKSESTSFANKKTDLALAKRVKV